jgi:two-component system, cell cycle response regulator
LAVRGGSGYDPPLMTEPATSSPVAQPAWRILLVDDEPTQRLIMARLLKRAGYEVETAANGKEALARIDSGDFQLMITDWEMPEMDGIALCSALRSSQGKGYIYTILLTARDAIEHVVTGLQAGADDYLTKPVIEAELIARLSTGKRIVTLERSLRTANEENRRLSITDPLTGAYNRRYLMEQLPREIERASRYSRQLSTIMCDVDYFKKINDTHGHLAGDEVLKWFVGHLQSGVRACDWVARYGGEEFVIVLPETNVENATTAAEHLRQQIAANPFVPPGGNGFPVSASFGVSGWQDGVPQAATLDALMGQCDAGVYASKSAGRNRVSVVPMD